MNRIAKGILFIPIVCVVLLSASVAYAQGVVTSYASTSTLSIGTIVELQDTKRNIVAALSQKNEQKMFGVVVNSIDSPLSLSGTSASNQVYVATSGDYSVLVDNQNGPIKQGDYISISSVDGIGAKAAVTDSTVLGRALSPFEGTSDSIGQTTINTSGGGKDNLAIGRIIVSIAVGANPVQQNVIIPGFLRSIAQTVSAKPVSSLRIYVSLVILLADMIVAGGMLYAGIRSSFIAIGRNPLSQKKITRSLVEVIFTSLIIFIIGLIAVYLLLKL